jgi:hypothetical protein
MTIAVVQFRAVVVRPVLVELELDCRLPASQVAEDLIVATAAAETELGTFFVQNQGLALTIFQNQPSSFRDFWPYVIGGGGRWLPALKWARGDPAWSWDQALHYAVTDLSLATLLARLFYFRVPEPLPMMSSPEALWGTPVTTGYKPNWNSYLGAATFPKFLAALKAYTDLG